MSQSLGPPIPSHYRSKQAYLASLPPWRRLLAKLNWHPVVEKKVRQYELRKESEQLRNENERLRNEDALLRKEDARLNELDARIASLLYGSNTSSAPTPAPADDSPI
jgi:hypothetical protein